MAKLSLLYDDPTIGNVVTSVEVADADASRFLDWAKAEYPVSNMPDQKPEYYLSAAAAGMLAKMLDSIRSFEAGKASRQAVEALPELVVVDEVKVPPEDTVIKSG